MLSKGTNICGYTVLFQLEEGIYYENYKVRDQEGTLFNLKLINMNLAPPSQILKKGLVKEMELVKGIHHPNIIKFCDQGTFKKDHQRYGYIVTESFEGFPLSDFIKVKTRFNDKEICLIARKILGALNYLHTQGIIHNNLSSKKIRLPVGRHKCELLKLIDFGYARMELDPKDLTSLAGRDNLMLLAPEQLSGDACIQSDIYSVGIVMYELFYRRLPWDLERDDFSAPETMLQLFLDRADPLLFPTRNGDVLDARIQRIIQTALRNDAQCRYETGLDMIRGLDDILGDHNHRSFFDDNPFSDVFEEKRKESRKEDNRSVTGHGNGFADVAGLEDIKEMLQRSIIRILKDGDRAKEYGISIPNGMLLYGPPGCGKSFFAEKFAEETGFNYKYVKASDLASIYIHGAQEKIGNLFHEAREKAPSIICFDEFDALVPKRNDVHNSYQAGEVNEFLSQLNNCGKDGVFVIATTNQPDMIDTAILRKGRIDNIVYLPPPDSVTRRAIFQMHLKDRPCEASINYAELADLTEKFVASDIAYVVNEAAIRAFESKGMIGQKMLETLISECKPSLSRSSLKYYEDMRKIFESDDSSSNSIGFHL